MITKDAKKLLKIIYEDYVSKDYPNLKISPEYLLKETKWKGWRLYIALCYLYDLGYFSKFIWRMGKIKGCQDFIYQGLSPAGINYIKNKSKKK